MKLPGWLLLPTPAPGAVSPFRSLAWGAPPWQLLRSKTTPGAGRCLRARCKFGPLVWLFWLFVRPSALAWISGMGSLLYSVHGFHFVSPLEIIGVSKGCEYYVATLGIFFFLSFL